jgi:hypothetical protein
MTTSPQGRVTTIFAAETPFRRRSMARRNCGRRTRRRADRPDNDSHPPGRARHLRFTVDNRELLVLKESPRVGVHDHHSSDKLTAGVPAVILWVPETRPTYATCAYSWITPPSRSRRVILISPVSDEGSARSGAACPMIDELHRDCRAEARIDVDCQTCRFCHRGVFAGCSGRVMVSMKSHDRSASVWERRKSAQVVALRFGAGSMPRS